MLLNDKSTDVLSNLLEHSKFKLMAVMAGGWLASSSLARGTGMVREAPWGLAEASVAVHRAPLSITDGAEPRESFLRLSFGKERDKHIFQR